MCCCPSECWGPFFWFRKSAAQNSIPICTDKARFLKCLINNLQHWCAFRGESIWRSAPVLEFTFEITQGKRIQGCARRYLPQRTEVSIAWTAQVLKWAQTRANFERSLKIREITLPNGHKDIAESINNLARLDRATGHYARAEQQLKAALALRSATTGYGDWPF